MGLWRRWEGKYEGEAARGGRVRALQRRVHTQEFGRLDGWLICRYGEGGQSSRCSSTVSALPRFSHSSNPRLCPLLAARCHRAPCSPFSLPSRALRSLLRREPLPLSPNPTPRPRTLEAFPSPLSSTALPVRSRLYFSFPFALCRTFCCRRCWPLPRLSPANHPDLTSSPSVSRPRCGGASASRRGVLTARPRSRRWRCRWRRIRRRRNDWRWCGR